MPTLALVRHPSHGSTPAPFGSSFLEPRTGEWLGKWRRKLGQLGHLRTTNEHQMATATSQVQTMVTTFKLGNILVLTPVLRVNLTTRMPFPEPPNASAFQPVPFRKRKRNHEYELQSSNRILSDASPGTHDTNGVGHQLGIEHN